MVLGQSHKFDSVFRDGRVSAQVVGSFIVFAGYMLQSDFVTTECR